MKIQELAEKIGMSVHAIRFYEKEGLLDARHVQRGANRYRHYTDTAIERLKLVKKFQGLGCSLAELKEILRDKDTQTRTNAEIIDWIRQKMADVERQRAELDQVLATLNVMLDYRLSLDSPQGTTRDAMVPGRLS